MNDNNISENHGRDNVINKKEYESVIKKGAFFILNSSGETVNSIVVSYYSGLKGNKAIQRIDKLEHLEMAESGCEFTYTVMAWSHTDYWDVDFKISTGKTISYRKQACNIRYWDNGIVIINIVKDFRLFIKFSNSGGCHN
ncbi:hypothetical protein JK221_01820 [Providencia sp. JGM172]|uniref:hypothetical protein n=1 Tax=unclassified Providencia TaxID=2633465 RepID=UPI001BAC7FE0|nr:MULTISPECIES: hypothetical protein [unclassified Providencia]MBS0932198.1 hypothetical protein [Providencia sp. JGM172]MBS0996391.1 hypothetical protein [Providencia sp. JGM178]